MSNVENAVACFNDGYSCSQAILATYGPAVGFDRDAAFKIAAGFSGGMRIGETCGVVTGAIMVIGLKHASADVNDKQAKSKTYQFVRELIEKFESRTDSSLCKELLACDISTPEGIETAERKGLFKSICPKMVQHAAEILEEILPGLASIGS